MRLAILAGSALLSACGPAATTEPLTGPAETAAAPARDAGVKGYAGRYYSDFIREPHMERYAPENLGLAPEALARFQGAMQVESPAPLARGGGSEALVFEGCRAHACPDAVAVLAIDTATGEAFIGVRDEKGETVLEPSDRIEALLDATSPSQRWSNPLMWQGSPPPADLPAAEH